MNSKNLRIVFMGTPDFALHTLQRLVEQSYNVVGVVTMPDKPIGRHQSTLQASPVKRYAQAHNIPVLQPDKLKSTDFLQALQALRADLQIVVAFRMLPEVVWAMPPLGTFNLHAALLPQYRGAAPINWAIINGDTLTGVTTFFLDHQIDTGRIIYREEVPILPTDTAGTLHDKLMLVGAELVLRTVEQVATSNGADAGIEQSTLTPSNAELRPAPKLFKDNCRIPWDAPAPHIINFIRGLSPYPAAWTHLVNQEKSTDLKIYQATLEPTTSAQHPSIGTVLSDGRTFLKVAVNDAYIHLNEIQLAGKKRMNIADFLRGVHNTLDLHVE